MAQGKKIILTYSIEPGLQSSHNAYYADYQIWLYFAVYWSYDPDCPPGVVKNSQWTGKQNGLQFQASVKKR